ncbi:MAG: DUF4340 domain-containing protein [Pirellulales bacterium]|nr:DUF4340 domain-containing protein [Pirellulales bacterium]
MSESAKTFAFVTVGTAALVAAYFINAPKQAVSVDKMVGTQLYADVEVDAPKRLKIVKFDRQTAETKQFEVASIDGVWSIPSKQDYPADATAQMAAAANALIDRKILRVAGDTAQTHDQFGVLDPLSAKLDSNSTGVGTRVTMMDADDRPIVDMIVGKAVKGAEGQRYVRENNKDVVYIVELDTASLSTSFDDWIEDDLLKISPFDIRKVFINDYTADLSFGMTADGRIAPQVNWARRGEITLGYNNDDAKWTLTDLKKYDRAKKEMVPDPLAADEEINQEALNELRNGLDDLLIVDVARKPDGLSADLKAGNDFMQNQEAFQDLITKGFSPLRLQGSDDLEILSSEGELVVTQRDGVEYVLRFGQLKVQTDSVAGEAEPADPAAGAPATPGVPGEPAAPVADPAKGPVDEDGKNLHRYLFVMARFNEDIIEKPELKELPALPEGAVAPDAETPKPEEAAGDDAPADEATPAEAAASPESAGGDEPAAADKPTDETTPETPKSEESQAEGESASAGGESPDDDANSDADAPKEPTETERIAAERKTIEEENGRAQDQYKETVEAGKKRVAQLNERFGDWYYVISNDVYKQIHLSRDQVIKKKDAPGESASAGGPGADAANPNSGLPNLPIGGAPPEPESPEAAESK